MQRSPQLKTPFDTPILEYFFKTFTLVQSFIFLKTSGTQDSVDSGVIQRNGVILSIFQQQRPFLKIEKIFQISRKTTKSPTKTQLPKISTDANPQIPKPLPFTIPSTLYQNRLQPSYQLLHRYPGTADQKFSETKTPQILPKIPLKPSASLCRAQEKCRGTTAYIAPVRHQKLPPSFYHEHRRTSISSRPQVPGP